MPFLKAHTIEFAGGPIDGRVGEFDEAPKPFVLVRTEGLADSVNPLTRFFRLLLFHERPGPFVLAVYELDSSEFRDKYRYLRSCLSSDQRPDSSHATIVIQPSGRALKPARLR